MTNNSPDILIYRKNTTCEQREATKNRSPLSTIHWQRQRDFSVVPYVEVLLRAAGKRLWQTINSSWISSVN